MPKNECKFNSENEFLISFVLLLFLYFILFHFVIHFVHSRHGQLCLCVCVCRHMRKLNMLGTQSAAQGKLSNSYSCHLAAPPLKICSKIAFL